MTEEKQELILIVDSEQVGHISKQFLCGFHSFKGIPNSHPSQLREQVDLVQDFHCLDVS